MLISFDEAIAQIPAGRSSSILLGNGFSRAWRNEIFNYANLLDSADFGDRDNEIRSLFLRLDTYDFEAVMRALISASVVLESYDSSDDFIRQIEADKETLKNSLIQVISNTHPDLPSDVGQDQFIAARSFISKFAEVFTVNYDLLFYWARNMGDLPPAGYHTDDGFRDGSNWKGYGTDQQVHFLHGALHIFDNGVSIRKHTFSRTGSRIIDQVRQNLDAGKFPLFVSEPTARKKKERIEHNSYLSFCYRRLSELSGTLFIFGHSMSENDMHIFSQIRSSRISQIFVSLFGDENSDENIRIKANSRAFLESAECAVYFFDASSARVWG